ncbi:ATP dependent DNA ligase [Streptomyces sp. NPDC054863]
MHVAEPTSVLAQLHLATRPGARIGLAEPDWDTLVVDAEDLDTSRAFTRYTTSEAVRHATIGRRLARDAEQTGFVVETVRATTPVFLDFQDADRTLGLGRNMQRAIQDGHIDDARGRGWFMSLSEGPFFAVPGRGSLNGLPGALLLGELQEHGGLRYLGSVGTGFTDRDRSDLVRLLAVAAVTDCPFTAAPAVPGARWVLPRLVAEVRYATRTRPASCAIPPSSGCAPSWHRSKSDPERRVSGSLGKARTPDNSVGRLPRSRVLRCP